MTGHRTTIGLLRANLPRYFPEKHGVWARCEAMLEELCDALGIALFVPDGVAANGAEARAALDACRAHSVDFILMIHGGFTMGDVGREVAASRMPLGVWTVPEPQRTGDVQLNSFVSLNMTMSVGRLVRDLQRHPMTWYHGAPDSPALVDRLRTTLRAIRARRALMGSRVGRIGGLAMTFYNMETSSNALRERLGVEVDEVAMSELQARIPAIEAGRAQAELDSMTRAATVDGVSDAQMDLTARCALALRDIAADGAFDALAVSDWPALQDKPGMHPGSAFTWLEETDGLACASEGDVLGAVTQISVRAIAGRPGALLDMTEPDFDSGRLLMWHGGGGPLYMADDAGARWINHPMIGREAPEGPCFGCVADFVFRPGTMSVMRIAREASAFFAMRADAVAQEPSGFDGCRGWMEGFVIDGRDQSLGEVVATVMAHGIEHHFVGVPGDHIDVFSEFAAWSGMRRLGPRRHRNHLELEDYS